MPDGAAGFTVEDETNIRPPEFSDDGLALSFSTRYAGQLLYVPAWSKWLRWDGIRWAPDDTLHVFDLARVHCREMAAAALDAHPKRGESMADGITSAGTIAAVERLARSDPRHARRAEDFDADPWVLNTRKGVLCLRTGDLRPHRKGDLFTKVAGTAPGGECPRWLRFLTEITQDDVELVAYLQRFIGYTLLGEIPEHAFAFLLGPGMNGKSVLLGTVAAILGDYAVTAMHDVFTVGRNDQHPTHLASLRGARMVIVSETEAGVPWAESRLKALVAGDKISARVMRGDPFEFKPAFTLWVAGNHRPALRNPDAAMRRRLNIIPLTYVPLEPDLDLPDALLAEQAGVMAWAVKGCLAWQQERLRPPAIVTSATDDYFAEQDSLAAWFTERCERRPGAEAPSRALYADWKKWSTERGEEAGTEKKFSEQMQRLAAKKKTKTTAVFLGIRLLPSEGGVW
jgi:putative DNA primase/helicase